MLIKLSFKGAYYCIYVVKITCLVKHWATVNSVTAG